MPLDTGIDRVRPLRYSSARMVKSFLFLCGLGLAAAAAGADLPFRTGTVFGRAVRFAEQADAVVLDGGKWALLAPGSTEPPELKPFPAGGGASGIPRADGTTVAICAGKAVGVWDFADASAPRRLANFAVPAGLETVAFWRRHLVVPGLAAGVLLSSKPITHNP